MIAPATLRAIAAARLQDAQALVADQRFDGAAYICGYAVELSLKAQICDTLGWEGYPEEKEFRNLQSFKTHDLEVLLLLSGREKEIKHLANAEWSIIINTWKPEIRYRPIGAISPFEVGKLVDAITALLRLL